MKSTGRWPNLPKAVFDEVLAATAAHRGATGQVADVLEILRNLEESSELRAMWDKYRRQFAYTRNITHDQIMGAIRNLLGR